MISLKRAGALAATAALVAVFAGCNEHTDKISSISENPNAYASKDVQVAGEVTRVYELPLGITNLAAYRITDGSGQIWVLSHIGAPREGDKVGVRGRVRPEGSFNNMALGAVVEEEDRRIK